MNVAMRVDLANSNLSNHSTVIQIPRSVSENPSNLEIPLVRAKISAGFPSPADDYHEEPLDFHAYLINHRAATFVFTVQGDSMTGAGILDGDKLIVDRSIVPKHNHIVVAVVNGEYTVKRLFLKNQRIELRAENSSFRNITLSGDDELVVWGVVSGILRKYFV